MSIQQHLLSLATDGLPGSIQLYWLTNVMLNFVTNTKNLHSRETKRVLHFILLILENIVGNGMVSISKICNLVFHAG